MCFAALLGLFAMSLQAMFPGALEVEFNPFGGWRPDDWYVSEELVKGCVTERERVLSSQLVCLRIARYALEAGWFYLSIPVVFAFVLCRLEARAERGVLWALMRSLWIVLAWTFLIISPISLVYSYYHFLILGYDSLSEVVYKYCEFFIRFLVLGFPWLLLCIWMGVCTALVYVPIWSFIGNAVRLKMIVTRTAMVAGMWIVNVFIGNCPSDFPLNLGHSYRFPGPNLVDNSKRLFERISLGNRPVWYSEFLFPKYLGSRTSQTRRATFGRAKGWCEARMESSDSAERIYEYYRMWGERQGFQIEHKELLTMTNSRFLIRVYVGSSPEYRKSAIHIQQFPMKSQVRRRCWS
jgi:hypothetical protein